MIEETAVRVEISAARFASQSIFDILRLTVQAMSSQNYGQQSLNALNRQERPLASVDVNKKTLPYIRRQLKQYSVDFSVKKDRDTGQMYLLFKGQDVDRIQTALENCIAERGKERHLFRFFQRVMQHGVKVVTLEYSLRDRLHEYRLGMKIENYAARHKLPFPW